MMNMTIVIREFSRDDIKQMISIWDDIVVCKRQRNWGFKILRFNAVVSTNYGALHLYKKLGFVQLGIIPGSFLLKDGTYQDIIPYYRIL